MPRRPRPSAPTPAAPRAAQVAALEPGRLVRSLRERVGLTQRQLAIRAGTTTTAISRLERGHVSPTVQTLERLLFCLGHRLTPGVEPLPLAVDAAQLAATAELSPDERIDLVLASQSELYDLLGAATRGAPSEAPVRATGRGPS